VLAQQFMLNAVLALWQATLAAKRAKALQEAGQTSAAVQQALIARVSLSQF
jgi:hypothetical protein